jgi:hypothetical protein
MIFTDHTLVPAWHDRRVDSLQPDFAAFLKSVQDPNSKAVSLPKCKNIP